MLIAVNLCNSVKVHAREMGNVTWVNFSVLIYESRNGKWEIGQFPISNLQKFAKSDFAQMRNRKWVCFSHFLFRIRQIENRINGISPVGHFSISDWQNSQWEMENESISHFSFTEVEMGNGK